MTADSYQLIPVLEAKLKNVSGAIANKPPLCSGTWEIPSESFQLSFKKGDDSAGYVKIPSPLPVFQVITSCRLQMARLAKGD